MFSHWPMVFSKLAKGLVGIFLRLPHSNLAKLVSYLSLNSITKKVRLSWWTTHGILIFECISNFKSPLSSHGRGQSSPWGRVWETSQMRTSLKNNKHTLRSGLRKESTKLSWFYHQEHNLTSRWEVGGNVSVCDSMTVYENIYKKREIKSAFLDA